MKKWNVHTSPRRRTKNNPKPIYLNKDILLRQKVVCVVMDFVDLQKYKFLAAHYHYFQSKKYFNKNSIQQGKLQNLFHR